MVTAAAAGWLIVSVAYSARAVNAGDKLSGLGDLLVGVAAAVAAVSGWWNSRKAKANSAEAVRSLGAPNGTTVIELLHRIDDLLTEIRTFENYQHGRNHDVLNRLTTLSATVPVLQELAERLLTRLKETPRE